ncbi:hypothetical protein M413DRAFT_444013 [Hebeloma cylindrosporum]|uniref:Uncharacterized protein n=1 Tax=Hebeloma cylindrosporum TaxID=76867 RepID=A0A0C3CGC3_HEBCY|nr:hypothetical protein M413DRAFT_444013 [Hebeloma cylindrosporum h7]
MSPSATLFIDDSQVQYLCNSLQQKVAGSYYNNTWSTVENDDCSNGWFQYTFYGTGIHVSASVAQPGASYSVKIDEGPLETLSGDGSFDSPTLSDGKHTITYATGSKGFPSFDYLTVTAGDSTALNGQTLAVDDADSSITYSGNWATSPPSPISFDYSTSLYRDTTHWSSSVGDNIQFQFTGSSVSVFGIAAGIASGGNITASYTLDGNSKALNIPQGTLDSLPMVELFHADVQPGLHTLSINITSIQSPRALGIDFIAYNASFNSITSDPTVAAATNPGALHKSNVGAKVGAVLGALAGVGVLAGLSILLWRKYAVRRNKSQKFLLP